MNTDLNLFRSFFKPLLLATAAAALLAGCSTNPATGQSQFAALMSPQQEANVGATEHAKIMQTMGERNIPPEVKAIVTEIGQKIAVQTERPDVQYKFFVLDSPMVNAFALPGGYVYVTRGLIALANSEAELAAVMAHEVGHITGRHSAERYSHGVLTTLGAAVIAAALDSPAAAQAAGVGSDLYLKSYSRGQEHEADALGVRYLQRNGYDAMAMASFLQNLQRNEGLENALAGRGEAQPMASYFSTHPQTGDRVTQVQALAAAAKAAGGPAQDHRESFLTALDGMMYGDSPENGFVRGASFYHPQMDFTFTVPPGFKIDNQPSQVTAVDGKGAALIFDAALNQQGLPPAQYLTAAWLQKPEVKTEAIQIAGRTGAMAAFNGTVGNQPAIIHVIALPWAGQTMFRFQIATPQGGDAGMAEALKRAAHSLRPLTAQEKQDIRPWVIRVVKAGAGDSVASLAQRMPVDTMKEEHFRVLNGLNPGENVQAGKLYKLISDR